MAKALHRSDYAQGDSVDYPVEQRPGLADLRGGSLGDPGRFPWQVTA